MMIDNIHLLKFIEEKFGADIAKWLVNIHQGGSNNAKGNRYELYFMAYKAFQLASQPDLALDKHRLQGQEMGFVDDICHIDGQHNIKYNYQAKNSNHASADWTNETATRFHYQQVIDKDLLKFDKSINTLVVVSEAKQQANQGKIPVESKESAFCIYFPDCKNTLELIEHTDISDFIVQLIDGSSIDKIDYAIKLILGSLQSNLAHDIDTIFRQASYEGHPNPFVKFNPPMPTQAIPEWIAKILATANISTTCEIRYNDIILTTNNNDFQFTVTAPLALIESLPKERIAMVNDIAGLVQLFMEQVAQTL